MIAVKIALIRGIRTFLQCFAGALVGIPVAEAVADIRVQGVAVLVAAWIALMAAVVAFCQNLAENL